MSDPRTRLSPYMNFAKVGTDARFNLASSGVLNCTFADLQPDWSRLELHGPNSYGYMPLRERIGARFGIPASAVVTAEGCSMANHLALAAVVDPGDEVVLEEPTYELITSTLLYLGAELKRVQRRPEAGWRLEPDAFAAAIGPKTKLVVLTNLHNPTSAFDDPAAIEQVIAAADRVGAKVLIDEVYLELTFGDGAPRTAYRAKGNVIVTSSLTKAYGVSGLRCGWILATPDLAERMRRLVDLYYSVAPFVTDGLSLQAFDRLPSLRARAKTLMDANRAAYRELIGEHPALDGSLGEIGTTVFPRLRAGRGDAFCDMLKARYETGVVPGRYFERPDHIRIGLAGEPGQTREALSRLAEALQAWI
ncbi:MAG: pyridoxal phosphate-dependent aminotransferase [Proteobacteria bacterium]|nr:pyridoxal phosphate-dependent aminotransferase [Pseudomonadota bacterium]